MSSILRLLLMTSGGELAARMMWEARRKLEGGASGQQLLWRASLAATDRARIGPVCHEMNATARRRCRRRQAACAQALPRARGPAAAASHSDRRSHPRLSTCRGCRATLPRCAQLPPPLPRHPHHCGVARHDQGVARRRSDHDEVLEATLRRAVHLLDIRSSSCCRACVSACGVRLFLHPHNAA